MSPMAIKAGLALPAGEDTGNIFDLSGGEGVVLGSGGTRLRPGRTAPSCPLEAESVLCEKATCLGVFCAEEAMPFLALTGSPIAACFEPVDSFCCCSFRLLLLMRCCGSLTVSAYMARAAAEPRWSAPKSA